MMSRPLFRSGPGVLLSGIVPLVNARVPGLLRALQEEGFKKFLGAQVSYLSAGEPAPLYWLLACESAENCSARITAGGVHV